MRTRRWDFVSAHAETFGVQRICRVLRVSRSGYYRWIAGAKTRQERQAADDALLVEIREIHTEHKGTYGVRRVHAELRGFGRTVNRKRIERLMRRHGIEGRHLRRRKRTTVPDRLAPPAPDLVQRQFTAARLDEKWCGSGSRREFHPPAPTEPCVTVSHYTALVTLITRNCGTGANARTFPGIAV
ncbi:IS3 family transposase [Streptomyces monashensis]|uniref:IS3 family transposase n=1 Tax=Streptomyces monashensis TaxID=1678012 RepID=UPI003F5424E8